MKYMFNGIELRIDSIRDDEVTYLVELNEDEVVIEGDEFLEMIADEISMTACDYHIAQEVVTDRLKQLYKGKDILYTESSLYNRQEMVDYLNQLRDEDMENPDANIDSPFMTDEPYTLEDL